MPGAPMPTRINQHGKTVPLLDDGKDRCMSCFDLLAKPPTKKADFVCPLCTKKSSNAKAVA